MSEVEPGSGRSPLLVVEVARAGRWVRGVEVVVDNTDVGRATRRTPLVVRPDREGDGPHDVWVRIDGIDSNHVEVGLDADDHEVGLVAEVHAGWLVRFLEGFWAIEQQDPTVTLSRR